METSTSYIIKFTLAILGPIVIVGSFALLIIYYMKRNHRKRLLANRNKQDPETYYASDDLLRATSAGDSTLRVK